MGLWSNVEARILAYIREGKLKDLPGEGRPLPPDPADGLPAEVRFEVLLARSAGHIPEEVALSREIVALREKLDRGEGDAQALRAELTDRSLRLSMMHEANGRYLSALLVERPRKDDE